MFYLIVKSAISGVLIMLISELARKSPSFGALVASLPLVSILGMLWLWRDTQNTEKLAAHAAATFWYVLPSLPMFLVIPLLLRYGIPFYAVMALSSLLTIVLYLIMIWVLGGYGMGL